MSPSADDARKRAELVSTISHELRGPISTIKGIAATSRSFYDQLPDDEKREFLELIEQEADRMLEIVGEASLAMKLSARVLQMQMGPADLAAIVREGVGAAGLGNDRRVDLVLEDIMIEGDHARLVEVVRQVVRNAGAFSPPGEPIAVTLAAEGDEAVLTVVDHGPGIPDERREQVFTTFPNWRPAGYEEVQGTGLGLFISRGLVAEHQGEMSVEDAPGGGTMLRIRLPAGRDQARG
ncbi:MAG TPA: ATP-binding protein [Actinomycetota bacterium]|nr:ATP-binding protein [Actinomycetota bacterium]